MTLLFFGEFECAELDKDLRSDFLLPVAEERFAGDAYAFVVVHAGPPAPLFFLVGLLPVLAEMSRFSHLAPPPFDFQGSFAGGMAIQPAE